MSFVWMRPTTRSPLCCYTTTRAPLAGKKLLSDCGIWETPYEMKRVGSAPARGADGKIHPNADVCPFCREGRRADVNEAFGRSPRGPRKGRSWRQAILPSIF